MWQQFLLAGSKGHYHLLRTETAAVARGDDASLNDESRGCSRSRLVHLCEGVLALAAVLPSRKKVLTIGTGKCS